MFNAALTRLIGIALVWLGLGGLGLTSLSNYDNASGPIGPTPALWPRATSVVRPGHRCALIMFAHPQCPCTRASLAELARLATNCPGRISAQVWFYKPSGFPADWDRTDLWRKAASIPGVTMHEDVDGAQAKIFGAETSGYVLFYDEAGRMRFRGGLTDHRGRVGDSKGVDMIVSLLDNNPAELVETPVYGCTLIDQCRMMAAGQIFQ